MLPALLQQPQREASDISRRGESDPRRVGGGEGRRAPLMGSASFLSLCSTALPSSSCLHPTPPPRPRRGDAPHPARSWGWAGAGCQPCWKQPEATHPPCPPTHTYKLENQYLLELEGSIALLLEMEAHSPERPHQCAWQLQRLHQCGGVAQSLGSQAPRSVILPASLTSLGPGSPAVKWFIMRAK